MVVEAVREEGPAKVPDPGKVGGRGSAEKEDDMFCIEIKGGIELSVSEREFRGRIEKAICHLNNDPDFYFMETSWQHFLGYLIYGSPLNDEWEKWVEETPIGTTGNTRDEYRKAVQAWLRRIPARRR